MKHLGLILGILMVLAGHPPSQETKPRVYYYNPDWSPDGSKIVFELRRGGQGVICTIQLDGSGLRELTSGETDEGAAAMVASWAADGLHLQPRRARAVVPDEP